MRTSAEVLALQRRAGNRAATALLQQRSAHPPEHPTSPAIDQQRQPLVQRGFFSFVGNVAKAAGSYAADLGRGVKRSAKGLRVWNSDALVKMHDENASAARVFSRLAANPRGTIEAALAAVVGGLATMGALPEPLKKKAAEKFQEAAPGILEGIIAKVVGKALAQKVLVAAANRILTSAVVKRLLQKLGASAVAAKSGVGIPLTVMSSLGLIEKASAAADRLRARLPEVYRRLAAEDLHLLWFVIEPHVPAITDQIHAAALDHINRTRADGREVIDSGGSNDRTPVLSGPERRTPVETGGDVRRIPSESGHG